MADNHDELHAGFTGTPVEKTGSVTEKAKTAVAGLRDEASVVASAAGDHPHAATALLLTVSALAFGLGYAMGHASGVNSRPRFWR